MQEERSPLQSQHGNTEHRLSFSISTQTTAVWMSVCMCVYVCNALCLIWSWAVCLCICMCFVLSFIVWICACVRAHIGRGLRKRFTVSVLDMPSWIQRAFKRVLHHRTKALSEAFTAFKISPGSDRTNNLKLFQTLMQENLWFTRGNGANTWFLLMK